MVCPFAQPKALYNAHAWKTLMELFAMNVPTDTLGSLTVTVSFGNTFFCYCIYSIYSNEANFAHVISQCVQFVIVLLRDRNLGRADELTVQIQGFIFNVFLFYFQLVNVTTLDLKTMFAIQEMVNVYVNQIMREDNVMNVRKDITAILVAMVSSCFDTAIMLLHNTAVCIELNAHSTVKIQLALDGCDM